MTMESTAKAIFITNTFAGAYPEEHTKLWKQFEKEVPFNKRSGAYGADNMAYMKWIRTQNNPTMNAFLKEDITQKSY
jgi:hypothetical protein